MLLFTFTLYPRKIQSSGKRSSVPLLRQNGEIDVECRSVGDHEQSAPDNNKCLKNVSFPKIAKIPIKCEQISLKNLRKSLKQEDGEYSGETDISGIIKIFLAEENFVKEDERSRQKNDDIDGKTNQRNIEHETCEHQLSDTPLFQTSSDQFTPLKGTSQFSWLNSKFIDTVVYIIF